MPALVRKAAAAYLGISIAKLLRLTADGTGVFQQGARGRGRATLYDVTAIAELVPMRRRANRRDRARAEQLHRGAQVTTLYAAIEDELYWVGHHKQLGKYGVSDDQHAAALEFLQNKIFSRFEYHFRPKINSKKK